MTTRTVEAEGAGALGGEAEVQPVAGVVLDDEQAPGRAGDGEDAGEDGVDRGAGEDVAADRGGQHALADEAGVRRLVAGAAAGDQRDLRLVPVGADDDADVRIAVEAREPAAGGGEEAVDRLGDDVFPAVDELGHDALLSGHAGAVGVEEEGVVRGGSSAVSPGRSAVWAVGHGDERVVAEREVEAGLVAEALDAGDGAVLALALADLLGAEADGAAPAGAPAKRSAGRRLIRGWPRRLAA